MEATFGHDFGTVRVHTDVQAAEAATCLRANAYTVGEDIVFGPGRYLPATTEGQRLLAHELTHVVQQRRGTGSAADHAQAEAEAHQAGTDALARRAVAVDRTGAGGLQLDPMTPEALRRQHEEDLRLAQQAPPLWLSLLGPAAVQNYYRNPAGRIRSPLLRAQAEVTTAAAAGHGALTTGATAVATGVVAAATTVLVGGISAPAVVGIGAEAAAGSATLAPVVGVIFTNPLTTVEIVHFGAGVVLSMAAAGGVRNWLQQIATPEGALQVALDVVQLRATIASTSGGPPRQVNFKGRVRSASPAGIEVVITEPPEGAAPAAPPAPAAGGGAAVTKKPPAVVKAAPTQPSTATTTSTTTTTTTAAPPTATTTTRPAAAAPQVATLDAETIDSLIGMWRGEIARNPDRAADYQRYIANLQGRRELLRYNRERGPALSGEQSERELQFLYSSRHKRVRTPSGDVTIPDATFGNEWAVEVKNWNVLFPTEEEVGAAAAGRLPSKLQGLADQVEQRRARFGDRQTIVIDVRGQLTVTGVPAQQASTNRQLLDAVGRTVATACGLPPQNIQLLVW
jgi:hypothetical protein